MKTIVENARFTFLTESLVRIEYSPDKVFNDDETLFAKNREDGTEKVQCFQNGNRYEFTTEFFKLTYISDGKPFSADNLYAEIKGKNWNYGMKNENNLGGTLATLDGIVPSKPVENGIISKDGWFVIDDSGKPVLKDNWIAKNALKSNTDIYLFAYGKDYKRALRDLFFVSGRAELPRKYVFGSWYSRWWPYTDEEIKDIVKGYDEHDFPLDIMVIDMDWHYHDWQIKSEEDEKFRATHGYGHADNLGWTGYTWNKNLIKNPQKLLRELHDDKIYITLNDHPADGIRTNEEWYDGFAKLMGFPPESGLNLEFDCSDKRYMDNFYKAVHEKLEKQGVDFWWVDWQQDEVKPYVKGIEHLRHLPWLNQLYYEHSRKNGKRGISFSRWGGWGDHKHPIFFSGDTKSTWDVLDYEIKFTISSSNAGCFYWGHDTGGFFGERNWEMYVRWAQFTAFSACLRVHSQRDEKLDRRPWLWGDAAQNAMKSVYHMRSQLIPYIYSSAYEAYDACLPLIRGMYIEFPNEENSYEFQNQYMFGDSFIVSPITEPREGDNKTVSKKVWIKGGDYYNVFNNEKYEDGTTAEIECDINTFPLLVKGGMPVPMQPYSKRMTSEALKTLIIRIYPGESGEFTLYEDDGISEEYKNGICLKTKISYKKTDNEISVCIEPYGKGYRGMPKVRSYIIELPLSENLKLLSQNAELVFQDGMNKIKVKERDITERMELKLINTP